MAREIYAAAGANARRWADSDALGAFGFLTGYPALRDRFGFLNQYSHWNLSAITEVFPASGSTAVFADLMDARAAALLAKLKSEGKQGYIFLSGGVDSTALTVALLKAAAGDYANLVVVYNAGTEAEYPAFTDYLSRCGIAMRRIDAGALAEEQAAIQKTDYTITGWAADQLFGSIINQQWPDWFFRGWKKWLRQNLPYPADSAIEQLSAAFEHYGLPVKTFGQFAWFMNFACKYRIVTNFDALATGTVTHRMVSFYDTPEFQSWSVSNFDRLHQYAQQDTGHYKAALKDYIFAFNRDADYRANKGKLGSWANARFISQAGKVIPSYCLLEDPDTAVRKSYYKPVPAEKAGTWREILSRNLLRLYRKK